ncbi:MAG: GYD domain-containing protein [Spirochaetaceae bacterium]|nr:MAG: GYD domain-containing protein [Spirochaetaceae bacterium]
MATFFMFGRYDQAALKGISSARTSEAHGLVAGLGGSVKSEYVLLGEHDLVLVVELPGAEEAMKASVGLTKLTGISFSTAQALPLSTLDRLVTEK